MKDALLQREDCNVILVDWSGGAKTLYGQSVGNTRLVGAQTAELIRFLIKRASGSPHSAKMFYIVGFSLGGQTAGYAGSYLFGSPVPQFFQSTLFSFLHFKRKSLT